MSRKLRGLTVALVVLGLTVGCAEMDKAKDWAGDKAATTISSATLRTDCSTVNDSQCDRAVKVLFVEKYEGAIKAAALTQDLSTAFGRQGFCGRATPAWNLGLTAAQNCPAWTAEILKN